VESAELGASLSFHDAPIGQASIRVSLWASRCAGRNSVVEQYAPALDCLMTYKKVLPIVSDHAASFTRLRHFYQEKNA
jgi:hypothetical protein